MEVSMSPEENHTNCQCEYGLAHDGGDGVRTGIVLRDASLFDGPILYSVVDGLAFLEGDILLGTEEEVELETQRHAFMHTAEHQSEDPMVYGVGITGVDQVWPRGRVPFEIASTTPNPNQVVRAMQLWEKQTSIRFEKRTSDNAASFPNYIAFVSSDRGTWSHLGMRGGRQEIGLTECCGAGQIMHLIGHTLGLPHEHSRADRDYHITIHFENVKAGCEHNFTNYHRRLDIEHPYDFESIMHLGRYAFSRDGEPTITPRSDSKRDIGQRNRLSEGDIFAVARLYQPADAASVGPDASVASKGDNDFWLERSRTMLTEAVPALDRAGEMLQKSAAWFWAIYSSVVLVSATVSESSNPLWQSFVLAAPSPLLMLSYLAASLVQLPVIAKFDPGAVSSIKENHQRAVRRKLRWLKWAAALLLSASLTVAAALTLVVWSPHRGV
jgi:hypothetical protein